MCTAEKRFSIEPRRSGATGRDDHSAMIRNASRSLGVCYCTKSTEVRATEVEYCAVEIIMQLSKLGTNVLICHR